MIEDFKSIIDAWPGGLSQFAEDIGTNANNAKQMRRNNSVASGYWDALIAKAAAYVAGGNPRLSGITPDLLVKIAAKKNHTATNNASIAV